MATKQKDRAASGAAIAGAGGVTAAGGLVGGGIPGFKSDATKLKNLKTGSLKHRVGSAFSSGRGGIFGYRTDAHQGFLNEAKRDIAAPHNQGPTNRVNTYARGHHAGKVKPELEIIRHMKRGKTASGIALGAGAAATAYGVHRAKTPVKKSKKETDAYHGALLGAGGGAAGLSLGAEKVLGAQGKKWSARSTAGREAAGKIIPKTLGQTADNIRDNPKLLAGKSKVQAEQAGRLRGDATQAQYFSRVYRNTAKVARKVRNPALGVAAVGAGGLLASREKSGVKKSYDPRMSAFGVEH